MSAAPERLEPPPDQDGLRAADHEQLVAHGIGVEEARRQLAFLRDPPSKTKLVRPARIGDGILPLPRGAEAGRLAGAGRSAARAGRLIRFVPASGAASRLFAELRRAQAGGFAATDPVLTRFEKARRHLPFDCGPSELLARYGDAPKALIPFHRYADGEQRTALEEHLVEGAALVGGRGSAAAHFTVAANHQEAFEELLGDRLPVLERRLACRFDVTLSHQSPATDSVAVDADGAPFRMADVPEARLLVRPGGHGALLGNLQSLADRGFELIAVKNIDNVQPEQAQCGAVRCMRILAGMARELARRSERPTRICGVVPAVGTAGGGPFWVQETDGEVRLQIVETSQLDLGDGEQAAILARSTHFNPVFLVCAALAPGGGAYRLEDYVDRDASFVVHKSHGGRELTALERPGLWNGSMAGWETRFVELPGDVYTPVKSVFDLAGAEHQCAEGELR
ncbi:MAG: DUF4301 family protein [Acidobacteria bacterium]|nr:DUF4301 family protein [Acidobacteriota bacterium]